MEHVRAGDMDEGIGPLVLPRVGKNVMQVIDTIEIEGSIGVTGATVAAGMHEMVVEGHIAHRCLSFRFFSQHTR